MVRVLIVVLMGLGLLLGIPVTHAFGTPVGAQIIVTTTADVLADDGFCSLREAIQAANLDAPSGTMVGECVAGMGDDTIVLGAGVYGIEIAGAKEDENLTGDFDIISSLTIVGQNANVTSISGNQLDRVLQIYTGTVSVQNVSITSGSAPNGDQGQHGADGGGIYNAGILILENTTVSDSRAGNGGDFGNINRGGRGGGIYNHTRGNLTILNSIVINNRSGDGGSGVNNAMSNGGTGGEGGGIFIDGSSSAQIQRSQIISNRTGNGARAPQCDAPSSCSGYGVRGGYGGDGGGIYTWGTVFITNSIISDNIAGNGGSSNIGYTYGGNGGGGGGIYIRLDSTSITNSIVANNHAGNGGNNDYGGGGNGGDGGGLNISIEGNAILIDSTIARNHAGIALDNQRMGGNGGGVIGAITITNSILAGNRADDLEQPADDCTGPVYLSGSTLIENLRGCDITSGNHQLVIGFSPQLGYFGELLPGSIAIDAGNCPDTEIDYLGDPRRIDDPIMPNFGDACDIGADELTSPLLQVGPIPIEVVEGGPADAVALVLTEQPTGNVTIGFANSEVYVGPPSVLFTPENWNVQQQIGVLALDNGDIDFTRIEYIDMIVESTDPRYNNLAVGNLAVQIRDNDAPMIYLPTVTGRD